MTTKNTIPKKSITKYSGKEKIIISIRCDDECNNGHDTFARKDFCGFNSRLTAKLKFSLTFKTNHNGNNKHKTKYL